MAEGSTQNFLMGGWIASIIQCKRWCKGIGECRRGLTRPCCEPPSVAWTQTQTFLAPKARMRMLLFQHVNVSGVNAHQCVEADVEVGEPGLLEGRQAASQGHTVCCHANRLQTIFSHFVQKSSILDFDLKSWQSCQSLHDGDNLPPHKRLASSQPDLGINNCVILGRSVLKFQ